MKNNYFIELFLFFTSISVFYIVNHHEVTPDEYANVKQWVKSCPSLNDDLKKVTKDGVIYQNEFDALKKAYLKTCFLPNKSS